MSVYQVEQFYIHINTEGFSDYLLENIRSLLIENNCGEHEFQDGALVVDDFESECDAVNVEELINDLINN